MIEKDTIKLLRECDAGVKMGISSIEDVVDNVRSTDFKDKLIKCKKDHQDLECKISMGLNRFGDDGKEPGAIAKSMSWIKTNAMLAMDESDHTVADLMTDGCNMGVKSLSRYLNKYKAADEDAKNLAKDLIKIENDLATDIRTYL